MEDNVKHFGITPRAVADCLRRDIENYESVFVVAVREGTPVLYTSGCTAELALAVLSLQTYACDQLKRQQ